MARQISVGIDIGSFETKVIIAERLVERASTTAKIIGTGSCESKGVSRGYVTNPAEAAKSVRTALNRAEKIAGLEVKRAYVSFGGVGLSSIQASGCVAVSRADLEITDMDLRATLEAAEKTIPAPHLTNRKIINIVPIEYKVDGEKVWGPVLGLKGKKVEVKALFIICLESHLSDLISAVEGANVEVVDIVASPVAESFVTLSKKQKRIGSLLVNIGAETLSMVVFEENNIISLEVFPLGSADITNAIALGLRIPPESAELIKLGEDRSISYPKKKLDDIISGKLHEFFSLAETHLKAIGRNALLPSGIILTGGGSSTPGIKSVAENTLKLSARQAEIIFGNNPEARVRDRKWTVACGLSVVGFNTDSERDSMGVRTTSIIVEGAGIIKRGSKSVARWLSQFLP